ncbi:hypothetical protein L9F63_011655, partial [Diploptera punctata]
RLLYSPIRILKDEIHALFVRVSFSRYVNTQYTNHSTLVSIHKTFLITPGILTMSYHLGDMFEFNLSIYFCSGMFDYVILRKMTCEDDISRPNATCLKWVFISRCPSFIHHFLFMFLLLRVTVCLLLLHSLLC